MAYFVREAMVNLLRGWKISLLAIFTIAVSLFVGGFFLLVGGNLSRLLEGWRDEVRLVVYVEADAPRERVLELAGKIGSRPWVKAVERISSDEARRRFQEIFPSLADMADSWGEDALPPSLEVVFDPARVDAENLTAWVGSIRQTPGVTMVDDDRDWLRQLQTWLTVIRGVGVSVAAVLLAAAMFTIASVIRLTAHLYRDEIAIMRLVGATEFFIRGPFYVEGLLQGLVGGGLAVSGLYAIYRLLVDSAVPSLPGSLLTEQFLTPGQMTLLVAFGGLAGLTGAVVSLRRESLGRLQA